MHWVLQENIFREKAYDTVLDVCQRFNISHSIHKVVPFVGDIEPDIDPVGNVICLGSYSMRRTARKKGWFPGVFDLEPINFNMQKKYWGDRLLNFDSVVTRIADAEICDQIAFLRPIEDSKTFPGRIFTSDELEAWKTQLRNLGDVHGYGISEDSLIQVSTPKTIFVECRYWIVKNQIVTSSIYRINGKSFMSNIIPPMFDEYVKSILDYCQEINWFPHDAYCLDVCETDSGMRIVEINTLNAAGFYAADVQKLIFTLEEEYS